VRYVSINILLVDDEEDIHAILGRYLDRIEGVTTVHAMTGEDAVAHYRDLMAQGTTPALVVMDLNLSGIEDPADLDAHIEGTDRQMDGVRATKAILNTDKNAVIWGYTAWFDTAWADNLEETGAKKVVDRTIPFKQFADMVKTYLRRE
jgi:CheY-like chemotaxis protein